jgi:hypothetical protein
MALVIMLVGCEPAEPLSPPPEDSGTLSGVPVDTGTDVTTEPPFTYRVTGQEGSVVVVNQNGAVDRPGGFYTYGVFADDLNGVVDAAWCLKAGVCQTEWPTGTDVEVDLIENPFPESTFSWVGNQIRVGEDHRAHFMNDIDADVTYYSGVRRVRPSGDPLPVHLGEDGSWGPFSGGDVNFPGQVLVVKPDPNERIDFGNLNSLDFEWTQGGQGTLFLRVNGAVNKLYMLEDDGEYTLDIASLNLDSNSSIEVAIGRYLESETLDVNGNTLSVAGVAEQPFMSVCPGPPEVSPSGGWSNATGSLMTPTFYTMHFQGLIDGTKIEDYRVGQGAERTAQIRFEFLDANQGGICNVRYDASMETLNVIPFSIDLFTGQFATVFKAWTLNVSDGISDCGPVDPGLYSGHTDVRAWIEQTNWMFGVGQGISFATAADTAAGFISMGSLTSAYEMMPLKGTELECETVDLQGSQPDIPRIVSNPIPKGYYSGQPLLLFYAPGAVP